MKKIFIAAFLLTSMGAAAQETYQNAELMTEDLNGTARYVGMGGAMEALGADISVIGTNPAGIGLFRKSTASISAGLGIFKNGGNSDYNNGNNKTVASFDQAGFVIASHSGYDSYINFGFNYHKSNNFNHILSAVGALKECSQNKVSYLKQDDGTVGTYMDTKGFICVENDAGSQVDYLYYNTLALKTDPSGKDYKLYYNDASGYGINRERSGYIGEYDFNISGNIHNRFYLGLTLGVKNVRYKNNTGYTEDILTNKSKDGQLLSAPVSCGSVTLNDIREITGTGFNAKFGFIVRPIEASPLRIGVSIATPTWYSLKTSNSTDIKNKTGYGDYDSCDIGETYNYRLNPPWQFGVSIGTTIGSQVALGLSYDYSDYSASKSGINNGGYTDRWGRYYSSSTNDKVMNSHTSKTLRGVSTVKAGIEFKPVSEIALRVGYNYVSPMYKTAGFRDVSLNSPGTYYASTTDFTNWKATHRITCGLGYQSTHFFADLAYQYNTTKGEFAPFDYASCHTDKNNVSNNRHQLLCTLGYRF